MSTTTAAAARMHETHPLILDDGDPMPDTPRPLAVASARPIGQSPPTRRNHALDNLRAFLTALVILHHSAIVYGGSGAWKIRSRCFPAESTVLIIFNAVDQTFFMGLFFFLSGYFTGLQISKKGRGTRRRRRSTLIRSRMLRILLPAVVYTLLVEPSVVVMVWAWGPGKGGAVSAGNVWSIYLSYWSHVRGIRGPVWYLALAMVFDTIAVLFLWGGGEENPSFEVGRQQTFSRRKRIWAPVAWAVTILCSFLVRLVYPVGRIWPPLSLQLAYVPQYVLAYFGGHFSALSNDFFVLMPFQYETRNARRKLFRALMFSLAILGVLTALEVKMMKDMDLARVTELSRGGFNVPAAVYAAWNEMGFALMGFGLVAVFLRHGDFPWTCGDVWLPRYSYGAFLLHPPVSVGVELAVESLMGCRAEHHRAQHGIWSLFGPVLLTLGVGLVNVIASWIAAWCFLSAVPLVGTII